MPDLPQGRRIHRNIRANIEYCGGDVQIKYPETFALGFRQPYLLSWIAHNPRYDEVYGIEDCVEEVEALQEPVKWITSCGAEDPQNQQDDRDFNEPYGRAVHHIRSVVKQELLLHFTICDIPLMSASLGIDNLEDLRDKSRKEEEAQTTGVVLPPQLLDYGDLSIQSEREDQAGNDQTSRSGYYPVRSHTEGILEVGYDARWWL